MARIVYSRHYNIGFYGLERLHPFDSRKYGRAWKLLRRHFGSSLSKLHVKPKRGASRDELTLVHSAEYLLRLRDPKYVASALEVPPVQRLPSWAIDWHVLRPMRWATRGTILAATNALEHVWPSISVAVTTTPNPTKVKAFQSTRTLVLQWLPCATNN